MSKRWAISCLNIHTVPFTILTSTMGLPISSSVICMYPLSIIILLGGGRISYLYLVIYGSGRIYIVYLTGMLLLIRGGGLSRLSVFPCFGVSVPILPCRDLISDLPHGRIFVWSGYLYVPTSWKRFQ